MGKKLVCTSTVALVVCRALCESLLRAIVRSVRRHSLRFATLARCTGPWWKGSIGEKRGAFPASYVKVLRSGEVQPTADGKDLSLDSLQVSCVAVVWSILVC